MMDEWRLGWENRKVAKEVRLADGVIDNLLWQGMWVTQVNRLLYAGGAHVASRMGLKLGAKKRGRLSVRRSGKSSTVCMH